MRLNPLEPNSPGLPPARGGSGVGPIVQPAGAAGVMKPIELDPALDAPVVEPNALPGPSKSPAKYLVVDENTLGYRIDGMPNWFGVLAAGKGSLHPADRGPSPLIPASSHSVRPATAEDFGRFNQRIPPDFTEAPSASPVVRSLTPMYFVENDNLSDDWPAFKTEPEAQAWVRERCQEIADANVDESGVGTGRRFVGMSRDEITDRVPPSGVRAEAT